jgi:hypothetical protein
MFSEPIQCVVVYNGGKGTDDVHFFESGILRYAVMLDMVCVWSIMLELNIWYSSIKYMEDKLFEIWRANLPKEGTVSLYQLLYLPLCHCVTRLPSAIVHCTGVQDVGFSGKCNFVSCRLITGQSSGSEVIMTKFFDFYPIGIPCVDFTRSS